MTGSLTSFERSAMKRNVPRLKAGDLVRVHQLIIEAGTERLQVFEGRVIALKHGLGLSGSFTIRKVSSGIGVEKVFPCHSPQVLKIERLSSAKVRRAKIYHIRSLFGRKARQKLHSTKLTPEVFEEPAAEEELLKIETEKAEAARLKEVERRTEAEKLEQEFDAVTSSRKTESNDGSIKDQTRDESQGQKS